MFIIEKGRYMSRPYNIRNVYRLPQVTYFKPAGVPLRVLEENILTLDEIEAIRLADFEGMYQEQAAEQMKVSRPTFSRIIESARRKVADALVNGKALRVEGGPIAVMPPPRCGRGRGMGWQRRNRGGRS
jgi:predicted DNA-binding protein (UPF0251 family)